ncbi:MAG: protein phosphatase 2C domain-containing protein [Symbiobacteriaceae bacterium]|nr:protein phosphatase 2C domain-containing protein [Symbiobacteriaceae bacterium]
MYASLTDPGMVRSDNQDALYTGCIKEATALQPAVYLLMVADGMGGYHGGDVAAQLALDTFHRLLSDHTSAWPDTEEFDLWQKLLRELVVKTNARILDAQRELSYPQMGTTLTVAVLTGQFLHMVHVGDSRLYILDGGRISQVTSDHSYVADMQRKGLLTPEEARLHPHRNVMSQALGVEWELAIEARSLHLPVDSTLLICSDGLSTMVSDAEIGEVLQLQREPADLVRELVDRANRFGGLDNITVIVAFFRNQDEVAGS